MAHNSETASRLWAMILVTNNFSSIKLFPLGQEPAINVSYVNRKLYKLCLDLLFFHTLNTLCVDVLFITATTSFHKTTLYASQNIAMFPFYYYIIYPRYLPCG